MTWRENVERLREALGCAEYALMTGSRENITEALVLVRGALEIVSNGALSAQMEELERDRDELRALVRIEAQSNADEESRVEELEAALALVRPHLAKSGCFDAETVDAVHRALRTEPYGE